MNTCLSNAPGIFGVGGTPEYVRAYNRAEDPRFASFLRFTTDTNKNKATALTMPFMYAGCLDHAAGLLRTQVLVRVCLLV